MKKVRIAFVGIGGFGWEHHQQIGRLVAEGRVELIAVAEVAQADHTETIGALKNDGVRIYKDALELFEQERGNLDLVTLPVGIALHGRLAVAAMEAGYNVLVEKPPAATIDDVDRMIATSDATGKFCAVQFQQMSLQPMRELKSAILGGRLGTLRELAVHAASPRGDRYYDRHAWAGQLKVGNAWVLDGPMNNAFAHCLMDLLFLGGALQEEAAWPERVRAEFYHARNITGSDTSTLLAKLPGGVDLFHGVTHACAETVQPVYRIVGSEVTLSGTLAEICSPLPRDILDASFDNVVDFAAGRVERLSCPVSTTRAFTATINAAHESSGGVHTIPPQYLRSIPGENEADGGLLDVTDISNSLERAGTKLATLSDLSLPWAQKTEWFDMTGYRSFSELQ